MENIDKAMQLISLLRNDEIRKRININELAKTVNKLVGEKLMKEDTDNY